MATAASVFDEDPNVRKVATIIELQRLDFDDVRVVLVGTDVDNRGVIIDGRIRQSHAACRLIIPWSCADGDGLKRCTVVITTIEVTEGDTVVVDATTASDGDANNAAEPVPNNDPHSHRLRPLFMLHDVTMASDSRPVVLRAVASGSSDGELFTCRQPPHHGGGRGGGGGGGGNGDGFDSLSHADSDVTVHVAVGRIDAVGRLYVCSSSFTRSFHLFCHIYTLSLSRISDHMDFTGTGP